MRANPFLRRAAAVTALALSASTFGVLVPAGPAAAAPVATPAPAIRITEFSYQLRDFGEAEFVELTNVGTTPVNLAGWSFDDVDAVPGTFDLSGFGIVAPGESVIVTDVTPAAFRAYWGLPDSVRVVGGSTQGLGNGDQINVWDDAGNLVDRVTYDDTPRSRDNSVVPKTLADLGANVYDNWELSNASNDPGSITVDDPIGPGTSIGSPGTSEYAAGPVSAPVLPVRITEFSYQLRDFGEAEFVELTNVGTTPVNLAGWSFSDSATGAGAFDLSGFGIVAPGESVVFTDVTATAFRAYWGLCSAVKVVGGSAPGLGNGDEISIWDDAGSLVDRATYDDTPRSRDNSVVPAAASALAANNYDAWVLSNASNDPGSVTIDDPIGLGTSIGSPGTSQYATVAFTPSCPPPPGESSFDVSTYSIVGRHALPTHLDSPAPPGSELATEVSAITYNWDTDTLFVLGDEGTSVVQVSKTGQLIDSLTLVGFADTEGLSYLGEGRFVIAEERLRNVVLFTYDGGGVLDRATTQAVKLGTTVGNIGLEGISYDPLTTDESGLGFIGVKESGPLGIFQTKVDFEAGTATNGGPAVDNPTNLFDPTLIGTADLSDVFPLSLLPDLDGGQSEHLLVISQESGRIVNVDRSGAIANQLDIVDVGGPLAVPAQTMEGVTVDRDGIMYTTSEGGGGDATHPQLLVWAPNASPFARLAVTEVAPWGSDATYGADWFELTNTGGEALDLTGVKVDDGSNTAASAATLVGVAALAPGESAIFFETGDLATVSAAFATAWFGAAGLPEGLKIGSYSGTGLGLSGSGDAVNLFAADDSRLTGVSFGAATPNVTFDNTARLGAVAAPVAISTLASEGVHGAFVAADGVAVGSPGNLPAGPGGPGGDTSGIRITEVAAFGSGESPYTADWFEVTNTGTESVNLTGWRMDDSSATFSSGVELVGVPVLPAGASAIFFEGTDDAAFELAFAQAWFGQNLFDAGFFFGHYASGAGAGLSTGGDAVVLFDAEGTLVTGVAFGASVLVPPLATFDNAEGLGASAAPFPVLTTLSSVGTNGAFAAVQADEIGSPGTASVEEPPLPPLASLAVTEVAPWGSSDSPYGSDWIEITNTGTDTVDLTDYAIDDDSDSFANARTLTGVASLAPGASAIFLEAATADLPAKTEQFLAAWVATTTAPAGFLIGNYSGSGIGLSGNGDQVNLFDPLGRKVTGVAFGASTVGSTFDNTAGASGPITTIAVAGVNGAFRAFDGHGVGSPANLTTADADGDGIADVVDVTYPPGTAQGANPANHTFSDVLLGGGGKTSGTILARAGRAVTVADRPNPAGVRIAVGAGGSAPAKVQLAGSAAVVELVEGVYDLSDPELTTTVAVLDGGPAVIKLTLNGTPITITVAGGGMVTYTELTSVAGVLTGLRIDAQNGVTVGAVGLASGACTGIEIRNVIVGTNANETINGTSANDLILARNGNDIVKGNGGDDCIAGGDGNDTITTGSGHDWIDAGSGNNSVSAGDGDNVVVAGSGNDTVTTGAGDDTVDAGGGNNRVDTGGGADTVTTATGNDSVDCGAGIDAAQVGTGNNINTGNRCETFAR